jgi:hypothetical protein
MRIRLDLNQETTKRLVTIALAERRSASDQAMVILEEALGLRPTVMPQGDQTEGELAGLSETLNFNVASEN